jgi:hypothetical protein
MSVPEGSALPPEEQQAGDIVAAHLGGTVHPRDISGAPPETHDLDVMLPDGRRIAVEVTSAREPSLEGLARAGPRSRHPAPGLTYDWWIGLPYDGTVGVKKLVGEAALHLRVVEQAGRESIGGVLPAERRVPPDASQEETRSIHALFELRVDFARRWGPADADRPAELLVSCHGGASSDFVALCGHLEDQAQAKVSKLIAAKADQAHLFIWVLGSASDAELALSTLPPPSVPPQLPAGIDVLWLASRARVPHGRLWRLRPPDGWEDLTLGGH